MNHKRLILARHAETNFNNEGRIQGQSFSSVLTPRGRCQARLFWKFLLDKFGKFDSVFCSDLPRATGMLEEMHGAVSPPIAISPMLREVGRGIFEGRAYSDPEWLEFCRKLDAGNDAAADYQGVESHQHALERGMGFLSGVARRASCTRPLLIAHGELNKLLVAAFLGQDILEFLANGRKNIAQPNCCINELLWDGKNFSVGSFGVAVGGVQDA